jgi:hypothetical protein
MLSGLTTLMLTAVITYCVYFWSCQLSDTWYYNEPLIVFTNIHKVLICCFLPVGNTALCIENDLTSQKYFYIIPIQQRQTLPKFSTLKVCCNLQNHILETEKKKKKLQSHITYTISFKLPMLSYFTRNNFIICGWHFGRWMVLSLKITSNFSS